MKRFCGVVFLDDVCVPRKFSASPSKDIGLVIGVDKLVVYYFIGLNKLFDRMYRFYSFQKCTKPQINF